MKTIIPLIFLLPILTSCYTSTNETEIALKVNKMGIFGKAGIQDEIYGAGQTHFYIPYFQEMYKFNTKLQTITMVYSPSKGEKFRDDLLFKTIDGNDISLDLEVQYRVLHDKAGHILEMVAKNDKELRYNIVRSISRATPRDIYGELKTEEFYISENRDKATEKVLKKLNSILEPMGVTVESVLLSDYRFNQEYQKAIEDKKIADQQAEKNKSATAAAIEEYKRKEEDARGEVNKMIALADGNYKKSKIEADANLEKSKTLAEAIKAEGEAQAKSIRKLNQALAGSGGRTMVKLEIAKAMKDKEIVLLPLSGGGGMNLKTTNMNDLLKVYGIQKLAK